MAKKPPLSCTTDYYRIGDYCKYMGVTPDFLKHYEQYGLIHAETRDNGYRYYHFGESFKIFECIKLKNHGFTVKEMDTLLHQCDEQEVLEQLEQKAAELERKLQFQQELLREYKQFSSFMQRMQGKQTDWQIAYSEPAYFLPHTRWRRFLEDSRIYELFPAWVQWMPVVRCAVRIKGDRPEDAAAADWRPGCTWGLLMPARLVEAYGLPVNEAAEFLPSRKSLMFHYAESAALFGQPWNPYHLLWNKLNELGLQSAGDIIRVQFMSTHIAESSRHNGRFIVPLE